MKTKMFSKVSLPTESELLVTRPAKPAQKTTHDHDNDL